MGRQHVEGAYILSMAYVYLAVKSTRVEPKAVAGSTKQRWIDTVFDNQVH